MDQSPALARRNEVIVPIPASNNVVGLSLPPLGSVVAVAVAFQLSTVVHVALRFISRRKLGISLGVDDFSILIAAVFANILCVLCCWDAAVAERDPSAIFVFNVVLPAPSVSLAAANTFSCITALLFTKISILVLYRRIFPQRWLHLYTSGIFVCLALWWLLFLVIATVFSSKLYDYYQGSMRNWDTIRHLTMATEALVVLDSVCKFQLLVIPIPIIVRLRLSLSRKIQAIFFFTIGCVCVMSSAVRFAFVYKFMTYLPSHLDDPEPFTTLLKNVFIWTIVDACLAIDEACLPMIKQLVEFWFYKHPEAAARLAAAFGRSPKPDDNSEAGDSERKLPVHGVAKVWSSQSDKSGSLTYIEELPPQSRDDL